MREETPAKLTEYYCDRDDCLTKRLVNYTKRVKKFGPAEGNEKPVNVGFFSDVYFQVLICYRQNKHSRVFVPTSGHYDMTTLRHAQL